MKDNIQLLGVPTSSIVALCVLKRANTGIETFVSALIAPDDRSLMELWPNLSLETIKLQITTWRPETLSAILYHGTLIFQGK